MQTQWETNKEIQRFRQYLQIRTVHPDVNYGEKVTFLNKIEYFTVIFKFVRRVHKVSKETS